MSHSRASAKPPATAGPLIAATTGLGKLPSARKSPTLSSTMRSLWARSPPNSVVSMPAQNAEPAPVRTRQRTLVVAASAVSSSVELCPQLE